MRRTAVIVQRPHDPDTYEALLNYFEQESSEIKEDFADRIEFGDLVKYTTPTRVAEVRQRLHELGIPESNIHTENLWERHLNPREHLTEDWI